MNRKLLIKITKYLVAIVFLFTLMGCGNNDNRAPLLSSSPTPTVTPGSSLAPTPTPTPTPYVYDGQEMLQNGSIESSITGNWLPNISGGIICAVSNDFAVSPINSLKIYAVTPVPGDPGYFWMQVISSSMPVNKQLKLQVKIKTDNITGNGIAIAIRCDDTDTPQGNAEMFVSTYGKISITGTDDWKTYQVEMIDQVTPEIKSITVYLIASSGTSGTAYFDDVSLIH